MASTNKVISINSLKLSMLLLHKKVNFATKVKTHYETLGVSQTATFSEIKSAYYDLTLKYHPDKNKSEFAKIKFQEISDAYDVLGKYNTRKQYDRSLIIKHGGLDKSKEKMNISKSDRIYHDPNLYKIYNFDKWLNHHYSNTFQTTQRIKMEYKMENKLHPPEDKNTNGQDWGMIALSKILFILLLSFEYYKTRIRDQDSKGMDT